MTEHAPAPSDQARKYLESCAMLGEAAATHTPGPWEAGMYKGMPTVYWGRGNGTVAIASCHDLTAVGNANANAHLIAAAPALLEACRAHCDVRNMADRSAAYRLTEAAIAKATGAESG